MMMRLASFPWSLGRCRLYSVLSTGELFLLYRLLCLYIWVLTIKMFALILLQNGFSLGVLVMVLTSLKLFIPGCAMVVWLRMDIILFQRK